ncbi:hypothetical protein CL621_03395 [archaeon]|nr:hypothetical protein [archaeon]|tara:strand:+ start:1393 stop:2124 length:732 start_codon:yes stop_codon:yes gene_type:complete
MVKKGIVFSVIGLLFVSFLVGIVYAEKLDIQVENNYVPGEEVSFKIVLYNDENNEIQGQVNYAVQNYYSEVVDRGVVNSGEVISFNLLGNAIQGPWKIIANYNEIEVNRLFNVGELEKAKISLEGDVLVLENIGNTAYEKKILIYIGQEDQTAQVFLEIGQSKQIKLTAPDGEYDIRVIEGNEEQTLEFEKVSLTGNVVGLEIVLGGSYWKKYPMVFAFLATILLVEAVVGVLKIVNRKKSNK